MHWIKNILLFLEVGNSIVDFPMTSSIKVNKLFICPGSSLYIVLYTILSMQAYL